jgi:hypothetical protein
MALSIQKISFLTSKFLDVPLLEELSEVQKWVISLGHLDTGLQIRGYATQHELLKRFENEPLVVVIKHKETVPINALEYEIRWR